MLDFLTIATKKAKGGITEIYPKFIMKKSQDLMIRGGDFYAIWVEDKKLWSTDEFEALQLIDDELKRYSEDYESKHIYEEIRTLYAWDAESGVIDRWHKYCQKQMRDSYTTLDEKLIFSNMEVKKTDYASKKLSYPLEKGETPNYDELMSVLYSDKERHKIEWAIGSIVAGESKNIQKFVVLYGSVGTGKSTVLNIIQELFNGYYSVFDAKALGQANNAFALEAFKSNPLVAIQHDGDLSKIEDNTKLNSLVSHESMVINEKYKSTYSNKFNSFIFMGTNKPVKITDGRSGLIRRLIDVMPTGDKMPKKDYDRCVKGISFELGAIAYKCREVFLADPGYYDDYMPINMMGASNDFFNFVEENYLMFKKDDGVSLKVGWELYKEYCDDAKVMYPMGKRVFKEELKNYFKDFYDRYTIADGTRIRNYYVGFRSERIDGNADKSEEKSSERTIIFKEQESIFDKICKEYPAQYATAKETPRKKWENVSTTLSDIDTHKLHYVKVPENHIVIDFDIRDKEGNKSFEKNLEEANKFPPTYAELSKGGEGIHLHYIYKGDASQLSRIYDENIEIKTFTGNSSLRRKLSKCNDISINTINSGLPLKGEKMVESQTIKSEKSLRIMIKRNLNKEIHPATKPSIDFIYKILEDAYESDLKYDVSDMRNAVLQFAANSTHQANYCVNLVNKMHFKSEEPSLNKEDKDAELIFFDIEVFPNLFLLNWKYQGEGNKVVRMINPTSAQIEELLNYNLVGFNCRRYDNHLLYARMMGYDNEQLYRLSQKLVSGSREAFFGEAYNLSYTDVYDFCSKKQSLKKWEIELGIHHQELNLPWDEPVPEDMWETVSEYCDNDVLATEALFNARKGDFTARQILADLTGMTVNDTTNTLTTHLIFGNEKHPKLVYTDLSKEFPGYSYEWSDKDKKYHNMYRGVDVGFGGYVYAEPGMYTDVIYFDVTSMHPNSMRNLNIFGEYQQNFNDILDARTYIKNGEIDKAKKLFDGKLAGYLKDEENTGALAQALKIAINSVYGLTCASFPNPFKHPDNVNNIVACRGALFMKTLQDEVEARGFTVCHIKTDSIKVANATPEITEFIQEFAKQYGYSMGIEARYSKMCLVNDAVLIAKDENDKWIATGKQFAVPYVYKTLFTHEPIEFDDLCETINVTKGALYLDTNNELPDVRVYEKELDNRQKGRKHLNSDLADMSNEDLAEKIETGHYYNFVGRVGQFCPVKNGGGVITEKSGELWRGNDDRYYAPPGTKGYRWIESETLRNLDNPKNYIDMSYYNKLVNDAAAAISKYGDLEWFLDD